MKTREKTEIEVSTIYTTGKVCGLVYYMYISFIFQESLKPNFSFTMYLLFRIPVELKQHYVIYILK
jgi:hypothetical protein